MLTDRLHDELGTDAPAAGPIAGEARFERLRIWRSISGRYKLIVGLALLAVVVLPVLLAPLLSSVGPEIQNPAQALLPPSLTHLMGTDQYGRSVLSQVLYGGRYTLGASVCVVLLGGTVGSALGLIAGYLEGALGFVIMRVVDLLLAFPGILLALAVAAILGTSLTNAILAVSVVAVPLYARIVYGAARQVRNLPYVRASQVLGAGSFHIVRRHVLPGAFPAIVVQSSIYLGIAALTVAGLGFLGLGVQPPTPEWGQLIASGQSYITLAWWNVVFPGIALAAYVVSVNMIGDGLRDMLSPEAAIR